MLHLAQIKTRPVYASIFLIALLAMCIAFIMQYVFLLEPCPLCIVQRIIVCIIGFLAFWAYVLNYRGWAGLINSMLQILFSLFGMFVSGRHVWLQHLPKDQVPGCLPGMGYLLETFSFVEALSKILKGSADCADVDWTFLGLSIPSQVFLLFIVFFAMSLYASWHHIQILRAH